MTLDIVAGHEVNTLPAGTWVSAWERGRPVALGPHLMLVVGSCGDALTHVLASQRHLRVWWRPPPGST